MLIAAVLPLVASAALSRRVAPLALVGAVVLGGVALTNERSELFRVTPGELKAMHRHMTELPSAHITQTGWNAYSRIDAVEGFESPYLARLYIDSDAWTNVLQWNGDLEGVRDYSTWYRALAVQARQAAARRSSSARAAARTCSSRSRRAARRSRRSSSTR